MTPEPAPHLTAVPMNGDLAHEQVPPVAAVNPVPSNERPADWNGISPPRRTGGGSARFLTDVLVELGFVDRPRVEQAVEAARAKGTTPENVLLEQGALSQENLARAIAERHGLDHLDLNIFHADMSAANDIALMTGYEVRVAVASREDIATLISRQSRLEHVAATAEIDLEPDDGVGE